MMKSLSFSANTQPIVLPALPQGSGIQWRVWIYRTGNATRQRILEVGAQGGAALVLGTGDQPDTLSLGIVANGNHHEITALGAVPLNRWVRVTAWVDFTGAACLMLFNVPVAHGTITPSAASSTSPGPLSATLPALLDTCTIGAGSGDNPFTGELSEVNLKTWGDATRQPPDANDAAWTPAASWMLDGLQLDHTISTADGTVKVYRVSDSSGNGRDGMVQGALPVNSTSAHIYEPGSTTLAFDATSSGQQVSGLQPIAGQLTMEAWINVSSAAQRSGVIVLQGGPATLVLRAGGAQSELALAIVPGGTAGQDLVTAANVIAPGTWMHVAATITYNPNQYIVNSALYVQGQLVARQRLTSQYVVFHNLVPALSNTMGSALIPVCTLGGAVGSASIVPLVGNIAEARFFGVALAPTDIASRFLSRIVGNESGLLGCYRLEDSIAGCVYDISGAQGLGKLGTGCTIAASSGLPLPPTAHPENPSVTASGELTVENIVGDTGTWGNLDLIFSGYTNGTLGSTPVKVFSATFQPRSPDGTSLTGKTLSVFADDWVMSIAQQGDIDVPDMWLPGQVRSFTIPSSGTIRLRFVALSLAMPTLRMRIPGMPAGIYAMVRLNSTAKKRLQAATPDDLKSPANGAPSPLPAGSTDADAAAHAQVLQLLGGAMEPPSPATTVGSNANRDFLGLSGGSIVHDALKALESVGAAVVSGMQAAGSAAGSLASALVDDGTALLNQASIVSKSAASLIVTGAALGDLTAACSLAVSRIGPDAIKTCIGGCDMLAIQSSAAAGDLVHTFSVIGTTLVNGARVAWRVVCAGVMDALNTVGAFFARIGGDINQLLNYLAYLFNWPAFLAAANNLYGIMSDQLQAIPSFISSELTNLTSAVMQALSIQLPSSVTGQSLSQLLNIPINPQSPVIKEVNHIIEQVQRVMQSSQLSLGSLTQVLAAAGTGSTLSTSALQSAMTSATSLFPFDSITPISLLTTPIGQLLGGSGSTHDPAATLLNSMVTQVQSGITDVITRAQNVLTDRLYVPVLTPMIEETILGGQTLNLLRLVALVGAIPQVLFTKIKSGAMDPAPMSFSTAASPADLAWIIAALSVVESLVAVLQGFRRAAGGGSTDPILMWLEFGRVAMIVTRGALTIVMSESFGGVSQTAGVQVGRLECTSGVAGFIGLHGKLWGDSWETSLKFETAVNAVVLIGTMVVTIYELTANNFQGAADWASFATQSAFWMVDAGVTAYDLHAILDGENPTELRVTSGLNLVRVALAIGNAVAEGIANYQQATGG